MKMDEDGATGLGPSWQRSKNLICPCLCVPPPTIHKNPLDPQLKQHVQICACANASRSYLVVAGTTRSQTKCWDSKLVEYIIETDRYPFPKCSIPSWKPWLCICRTAPSCLVLDLFILGSFLGGMGLPAQPQLNHYPVKPLTYESVPPHSSHQSPGLNWAFFILLIWIGNPSLITPTT